MDRKKSSIGEVSGAEIKKLVIERLKTLPSGKQISIGGEGAFTKEELIKRVKSGDKLGRKIIAVEIEFLRALKKGEFFNEQEPSYHQT